MIRKLLSGGIAVTVSAIALSIAAVATGGSATLAATNGDVHIGGSTTVLAATNGDIYVGGISTNGQIHLGGKASGCPDSPDCPLPDRIWPDN
jgi:hypothetical protein